MGKYYESITDDLADWIKKQKIFFVASAPLDPDGVVNSSPKGHDCFRILGPNKVCYLELSGSGIETLSHVKENGRLTIMFCAFEGAPRILRLWSRGEAHVVGSPSFDALYQEHFATSCPFAGNKGIRSIIVAHVFKVGTSCGYAVPFFDYKAERNTLAHFFDKKQDVEEMYDYWLLKNTRSLDGLPGLRHPGINARLPESAKKQLPFFERKFQGGKPYPPECDVPTAVNGRGIQPRREGAGGKMDWVQAGAFIVAGFAAGISVAYLMASKSPFS